MLEIQPTAVQIKKSDGHEDKYVLVHDGRQVIEFAAPGRRKIGTHPGNTLLVGTKDELEAEIARRRLAPMPPRQWANRRRPEAMRTER